MAKISRKWKKAGANRWKHTTDTVVDFGKTRGGDYRVDVEPKSGAGLIILGNAPDKKSATKMARRWMRKHPNG